MMKKFLYLTSYSIKKKLKSKSFLITNIILLLIILVVTNLDSIVKAFGGDFTENYNIVVVDNTGMTYDYFKENYNKMKKILIEPTNSVDVILSDKAIDEVKKDLEESKDILVVFEDDEQNYIKAQVISKDFISSTEFQYISQSIIASKVQVAMEKSNIDNELLNQINKEPDIVRVILDVSKSSEEETANQLAGVIFPIVLLPVFLMVTFLTQIIGGEINEEKTTRSMEIIISNVSSKTHLFSHIIADNLFLLVQSLLLGVYGIIGGMIRSSFGMSISVEEIASNSSGIYGEVMNTIVNSGILSKLSYVIPITLVLLVLSFFTYSFLAAVLASMSTNLEDYQQVQTPIMMISMASFYLAIMSSLFEGSLFIRILSYFPLVSPFLSPTLLIGGQITVVDSIVSIVIAILFIAIVYRYGIRIYKEGLLNYSSDKIWRRMLKAAKCK